MKRLAIIVPYRDRLAHLEHFTAHLRAYFARDKADREISYHVVVIEQDGSGLFNRGALKNIGFLLTEDYSDYTCFHDVDYLPIWADYSWANVPTGIVWYGAEVRPIAPGAPMQVTHDIADFFGGVILLPNRIFRQVNGYSNAYWGWGYEDRDLKRRFLTAGIVPDRRRGTFAPLHHVNEGYRPDGTHTPIASVNRKLFEQKGVRDEAAEDGLAQVAYDILERRAIPDPKPERTSYWELVRVRLRSQPSADHDRAGRQQFIHPQFMKQ
jgi:hypothetical protein